MINMDIKKTLVMVVVFPEIVQYLGDFFESANNQIGSSFSLLVLNDQLELKNEHFDSVFDDCKIIKIPCGLNPAQIRLVGIEYALEKGYDYLIFCDADDYFSFNRIEASISSLNSFDFVFNEIDLVNIEGKTLKEGYLASLKIKQYYNNYKDIIDCNMFGMGHTGVRTSLLNDIYIPKDIIAVDWWLFTVFLLNGAKGKFIMEASTYYRQSGGNLVGMNRLLDKQRLSFGIKVKTSHYKNVIEYCRNNNLEIEADNFGLHLVEMEELASATKDEQFVGSYIQTVNDNFAQIYKGWWSEILPLEDWMKYAYPPCHSEVGHC